MTDVISLLARLRVLTPNEDALQERLDELVIDIHSQRASVVNNEGMEVQLEWLLENVGMSDINIINAINDI